MTTTLAPTTTAELDAITSDGPTAVVITITPQLAKELLRRNTRNRKLRERAVGDYARDMAAGHWAINGEAIKIASNGDVLDGQHRLHAIVQAATAVDMFVVIGLDPAAQETMDSGRKRSTADVLALRTRVTSERLDNVRMAEDRFMAYLIRTWNAVRDGRDLARLIHKPGTEIPMPK